MSGSAAYWLPSLLAGIISLTVAFSLWPRRSSHGAKTLMIMLTAAAEWALLGAFHRASPDLSTKILLAKIQYLGVVTVTPVLLVFVFQYTGRERWVTGRNLALLALLPMVTLILVWTNEAHHLIWTQVRLDLSGASPIGVYSHGPWFWAYASFHYLLLLVGTVLLIRTFIRSPRLYRMQVLVMLIGMGAPWLANFLYLAKLSPWPSLDLTPVSFNLTGLVLAWGLFRFRISDLVPVARETVLENMPDGVFVLDVKDRVVGLNPAAQRIVGRPASDVIGKPAADVVSGRPDLIERFGQAREAQSEIVLGEGDNQRNYDLRISPLEDGRGRFIGRLVTMRDFTHRKQMDETIRKSLQEKELLMQEIHHRVKNNMAVISSLLNIQANRVEDQQVREALKESQNRIKAMAIIHETIYRSENLMELNLQDYIERLVRNVLSIFRGGPAGVAFKVEAQGVSLEMDQAVPCGLIINELITNALKYAFPDRDEGEVHISARYTPGDQIELEVRDNGVGLPADMDVEESKTLGMRLVSLLVGQLGGVLEIMSDRGAKIMIRWPLRPER